MLYNDPNAPAKPQQPPKPPKKPTPGSVITMWLGAGVIALGVLVGLRPAGEMCGSPLAPDTDVAELYDSMTPLGFSSAAAECNDQLALGLLWTILVIALGVVIIAVGAIVKAVGSRPAPPQLHPAYVQGHAPHPGQPQGFQPPVPPQHSPAFPPGEQQRQIDLSALDRLHQAGLLTDEEHAEKRRRILGN
ncbi:hypothetical protein D477_000814 [Arthrobacter crystallopoietes BAB-32]|uniref:SHOCT domain-containing protein n=2 Tax=Crystallibacter crystallopoietes TaxID=37928 RepID=N1V0D5_9MICC|nr:hypothetical protein D477_000814 [Arthrobacter crystallopoietes BAB-32]